MVSKIALPACICSVADEDYPMDDDLEGPGGHDFDGSWLLFNMIDSRGLYM